MSRSLGLFALFLSTAAPAIAQRADENAVKAAGDAFGTSVGNEKIGLYSADSVRGFSPITAGNVRVEGLAVTEHGGFTNRVVSGSTIRVGLTAQGYPFPAPTGIADYSLRNAGGSAVLSPVITVGPYDSTAIELDAQLPIVPDKLSFAGGVSYRFEENFAGQDGGPGEDAYQMQAGGVLAWQPSDTVGLKSFFGRMWFRDDRNIGQIFTSGPYQPPKIERRFFGTDWAKNQVDRQFYGTLGSLSLSDAWLIRAGLFRWENESDTMTELFRSTQPDGGAQHQVVATKDQRQASTSGELRSSYSVVDGGRQHTIHLAVRGRRTTGLFGGSDLRSLGQSIIGENSAVTRPDFVFGTQSQDNVRQVTGGLGYELRWPGVVELSLGLQKTHYQKKSAIPGRPLLVARDNPWLYNGTLALHLTDKLIAYAGYTRGLEESGAAPANAVNRNEAPPALRTSQRDAGIRYAIRPGINLVAGLFDVRKPYFSVDQDLVYRNLGAVRHRGLELSVAGQPAQGLSVVAGAVFLDADVLGEAVELGSIGPKPVGTSKRLLRANVDWRLPFFDPLSIDVAMTNQAGQIASVSSFAELGGKQLTTDDQTLVDLGARFRFKIGGAPATLRGQVTNLFDTYRWKVGGNGSFRFIDERRFILTLAADL